MQERVWSHIDKSAWGDGQWLNEPDKVQWPDKVTGLPCLAVRHPSGGHWCGYVGVAEGHPLFSVEYGSCPQSCKEDWCDHRPESVLDVHGGITFSDYCHPEQKETGICHIPDEGESDRVYWFGFDCAHFQDLSPSYAARFPSLVAEMGVEYRTLDYVKAECAGLARQLAEAKL